MLTGWRQSCLWFSWPKQDVASNSHTHTKPSSESQTSTSAVQARALPAGSSHSTQYIHLSTPAGCWAYNTGASHGKAAFCGWSTKTPQLVFGQQNVAEYQWQSQYGVKGTGPWPYLEGEVDQNESCSSSRETSLQPRELLAVGWLTGFPLPPASPNGQTVGRAKQAQPQGQAAGCSSTRWE